MQNTLRLSKRLANEGLCSRREAEVLIDRGWIKVNGQKISEQGFKVSPDDLIEVSDAAHAYLDRKLTLVLHKPIGYISHASEDKYPHVFDLITKENCYIENPKPVKIEGMAPVGRLDIDSRGLLLLSQDGKLAKVIIGENSKIKKRYIVKLDTALNASELKRLKEGNAWEKAGVLKPVEVREAGEALYEIGLFEGKKRQIRRMMDALNKKVYMLKRIAIGPVSLGDLPEGKWRHLTDEEKTGIFKYL